MAVISDATHAYRGYRLQALYSLHRVLRSKASSNLIFQPEGQEDLSVSDTSGDILEVIQVKSYTRDLALSNLKPEKRDSFLYRAAKILKQTPDVKISIVSYGAIGSELLNALQKDGRERHRVAKKLKEFGLISETDAWILLNSIQPIIVDEAVVRQEVYNGLENSLMGVDPDAAFELLHYWLYDCAENKRKITRQDVVDRVHKVGKFLAERQAHLKEWGTTIVPIEDHHIDDQTQEVLAIEFYRGISANYNHILADLDVVRHDRLNEIAQGFEKAKVVIVHGASGQGKTSLAYRYLREFFPTQLRLQIQLIENRQHALNITTAIIGQADAMDMPIAVYLDVSASDKDWPDVVGRLFIHHNIHLLITIREEDFRRATFSGTVIPFVDIELEFNKIEAREIYQSLVNRCISPEFLSFEDAWRKFGEEGPLMEFTHLITQGNTLRERLLEQVTRLKDDVRGGVLQPAELQLLRLISVASAYEARLSAKPLAATLELAMPTRTFQLFEKEYLIRLSDDGFWVFGLHPIRSTMLGELLTDSAFAPWSESAQACLQFMHESDLEIFLLHAFSKRPDDMDRLCETLDFLQPTLWAAIAGVTRALIWLGVREYVITNHQLIEEAFEDSGKGWDVIIDSDIAEVMPEMADSTWQLIDRVVSEERQRKLTTLRSRQTDKKHVFVYAREWLAKRTRKPLPPQSDGDWAGMAECLFWIARFGVSWPLPEWLADIGLDTAIDILSVDLLGDVVLGLSFGSPDYFTSWMTANRTRIVNRFRQATQTVLVEDDGQKVVAHFLVELDTPNSSSSVTKEQVRGIKDRFHEMAIERIGLMRKLLPDRETYGCQGYGHKAWLVPPLSDGTHKLGVARGDFPPIWPIFVNSSFRGLAEQEYRLITWQEFAESVLNLRRDVIVVLHQLSKGLERYFKKRDFVSVAGKMMNMDSWDKCIDELNRPLLLPLCAVDEWGFVDEATSEAVDQKMGEKKNFVTKRGLAIQVSRPLYEALNDFMIHLSIFFQQSVHTLILNPLLGRTAKDVAAKTSVMNLAAQHGIKQNTSHLSTFNLAEVVEKLPQMQREFRALLGQFVPPEELAQLERQEQKTYQYVWNLWYTFETKPQRSAQNVSALAAQTTGAISQIETIFLRECRPLRNCNVSVFLVPDTLLWEEEPARYIMIDGKNLAQTYKALEIIYSALRKAIQKVSDTDLREHVLKMYLPFVVVVPLVKGKSLSGTAWRWFLPSVLKNNELEGWELQQLPMNRETMAKLKITMWENPGLDLAQRFLGNVMALSLYAMHVSEFLYLPVLDDTGLILVQEYLHHASARISEFMQGVHDTTNDMLRVIDRLPLEEIQNRPYLPSVIQGLNNLKESLSFSKDGEIEMSVAAFAKWAEQLIKAREDIELVYLAWVSDIIDSADVN